jgi:hypothetical protein
MLMPFQPPSATPNDMIPDGPRVDRRVFCARGLGLALATGSLPALLAACGGDDDEAAKSGDERRRTARPVVGDVLDFSLRSGEWAGAFGFVSLRLHRAVHDGARIYFIQTDTSDLGFAREQRLVHAPKIAPLAEAGLTGDLYLLDGDQPAVVSSEPGRRDYTPAWRVHRVTFTGEPRQLRSVAELRRAEGAGQVQINETDIVLNAPIVKWSSGALAVDGKLRDYLGDGQLIERPDTRRLEVMFKLHECFPGSRYIVTDHSIAPAAEMTSTVHAPRLHGRPEEAGATGRTNVFMNGLRGPGPMKHQPSVFDSDAGQPQWSPYWDHFAMEWRDGRTPRVLRRQPEVLAARDRRELEEFPGVPDTKGEVFTVNCPVPVVAPATFRA